MFFKQLKRGFFIGLLIITPLFIYYLSYLDQQIRSKFEGKRWDIPAKIYANPLDLYVGSRLTLAEFKDLLEQLHYRNDALVSSEGAYQIQGQQLTLKTRSFTFWDGAQPSLHLKISFSSEGVKAIADLKNAKNLPIVRLDPVQIGSFYPKLKEDRILITLKDAPVLLKQALLATEDRDFYQHHGVSPRGLARALFVDLRAGGMVQGGSTLTQQLVKNFYLTSERSLKRKFNELFMALLLEFHYSKDEILEAYLNEIYLGQDGASAVHGFGLASEFYFAQPLKSLSLPQIASLIALVRGPSYYDLRRFPDRALKRRDLVLNEMQEQGYITEQQATAAKGQALQVIANTHRSVNRYPAFLDLVKQQLSSDYQEADLTTEGLRVFTTLDTQVQAVLEKNVAKKLTSLEKRRNSQNLEAAALITRREGGEIVALVGGRKASEAGFNRALEAVRPIGSLIKPAIYLTVLSDPSKYTVTTLIDDSRQVIVNEGSKWIPQNYDHREHGRVPLHTALAHSYNLSTVRIGMEVGLKQVVNTLQNLGVTRDVELLPSLLLGSVALTPMEVTQMYQTFADDGFVTPLRAIREVSAGDGKRLQRYVAQPQQTVDKAATYLTNTLMQEVVREGTAKAAYNALPKNFGLAGKTGTSNDLKDSWFAGFSGDYLSVVWIGRDDNKPMGLSGASGALQVWISVMKQISKQAVNLIAPDNVQQILIDPRNGLLANTDCANARAYPFVNGSAPTQASDCTNIGYETINSLPANDAVFGVDDDNNPLPAPPVLEPEQQNPPPTPAPAKSWLDSFF